MSVGRIFPQYHLFRSFFLLDHMLCAGAYSNKTRGACSPHVKNFYVTKFPSAQLERRNERCYRFVTSRRSHATPRPPPRGKAGFHRHAKHLPRVPKTFLSCEYGRVFSLYLVDSDWTLVCVAIRDRNVFAMLKGKRARVCPTLSVRACSSIAPRTSPERVTLHNSLV
jgi:hypothetical protein